MKWLITGGCGFIGSNFIRYILHNHKDCDILNVDKLTYAGNMENLRDLDVTTQVLDIGNPAIYLTIRDYKPDIIVNFAAQTHVDRSVRYPTEFIDTDVMGLFNLVYHSMKLGVEKFIHISTDEVYGSISKVHQEWDDDGKSCTVYPGDADEKCMLNPTSPYAASKAAGDLIMSSYIKTYNFPAIIIRPCNNYYGPRQYPEKLIPMIITQLLQSKPILLHGEGKEVREWLFVEDCCRAIDNIIEKGRIGEIYNVGSGDRINNINVIRQIIEAAYGKVNGIDSFIKRVIRG
ncbi:MAG: dTDP-glucose 4,6-dehydratase [Candidatus Hodarchaeales archaeon]|jgi:dTDP-glucose 4,6-dehydratase